MTTGRANRQPRIPTQRREATRRLQERRRQNWVLVLAAFVVLVIIAIPSIGFYLRFVVPPKQVVVSVNDVERTMGQLVDRARARVATQVESGGQPQIANVPFDVLTTLIDEEVLFQGAPNLGVAATRDDVDENIRSTFYPSEDAGTDQDQNALEREFQERYLDFLTISQLSDEIYRQIARSNILRGKARDIVGKTVPSVEESVFVHWIRVADESVAANVMERLDTGEKFDAVAREVNGDRTWANHDGQVGWVPRGAFFELEEILFSIEQNVISDPLRTQSGVHILKVTEGPEFVEVNDKMKEVLKTRALENWLEEQRELNNVVVDFDSQDYDWVISKIIELTSISRSLDSQ
jgi:parvulin-like peptidyl-prolyl isomerase